MEFSNALPIQFWPVILRTAGGTQTLRILFTKPSYASINTPTTFNELQNQAGVNAAPYFSPMDFADDLIIQFRAATGGTYKLNMIRDDGHAFIFNQTIPEISTGIYQLTVSGSGQNPNEWGKYQFSISSTANLDTANILSAIAGPAWVNQSDGGENWGMAAGQATVTLETLTSPNSNRLLTTFSDTATTKTIRVLVTGTATQVATRGIRGYMEFRFYKDGVEDTTLRRRSIIQFNENANSNTTTACAFSCRLLIPAVTSVGIDAFSFSAHITSQTSTSEPDAASLFTVSSAVVTLYSDNMIIYAKSDHHDVFWGEWDELAFNQYNYPADADNIFWPVARTRKATVLLRYTNSDEFNGLDYSSSPGPYFNLRVPGTFLHSSFEREEESQELSDDEWLTIWSSLHEKRKLEISHVPYYIIRKLNLVFMHDYINVGAVKHISFSNNDNAGDNPGIDVVVRDPLQINEGDRRYPLKTASVLLTDKDFIKRNLL